VFSLKHVSKFPTVVQCHVRWKAVGKYETGCIYVKRAVYEGYEEVFYFSGWATKRWGGGKPSFLFKKLLLSTI